MNKREWAAKKFDTDISNVVSVVFLTPLVDSEHYMMFTANIIGINGTHSGMIPRSEYDQIEGV